MAQRQSNPLNRSRLPERRAQVIPAPTVAASGTDVIALAARVSTLETLADGQAVTIADHEARIAALEAQVADHEARIAALEP